MWREWRYDGESHKDEDRKLAADLGKQALDESSFAGLTVSDLRVRGVIPYAQDLTQFMIDKLSLNRSLELEVCARVARALPLPVDVSRLHQLHVLDKAEAFTISRKAFDYNEAIVALLRPPDAICRFNYSILRKASIMCTDDSEIFALDDVGRIEPDVIEKLLQQDPATIQINGSVRRYALAIPQFMIEDDGVLGGLISPSSGAYLVVPDDESNDALMQEFLEDRTLLRYVWAKNLQALQREKYEDVKSLFREVAIKKYNRMVDEVKVFNAPVVSHLISLLHKEASANGEMTVMRIYRDDTDASAFKGEQSPYTDRIWSESGADIYTITTEKNCLVFSWNQTESDKHGKGQGQTHKVYVRLNEDQYDDLECGINLNGKIIWSDEEPANRIREFFRLIRVVTVDQRAEHNERAFNLALSGRDVLLGTTSCWEFFARLKLFSASAYPRWEYLTNSSQRLRIIVDATRVRGNPLDN